MQIQEVKDLIIETDRLEEILVGLDFHNIKRHNNYYSASWSDGDNPNGLIVYDSLNVLSNTRDLTQVSYIQDIFTVVQFVENLDFYHAVKWICDLLHVDIYQDSHKDIPESIKFVKMIYDSMETGNEDDEGEIVPIDESILKYYNTPFLNNVFLKDGISYQTQFEFNIGYDELTNRITIPVYSPYDDKLIGVKGRLLDDRQSYIDEPKYFPLKAYPKGRILYGLNKTRDYIRDSKIVYVAESEKGVMQLWSAGIKNCVATGGCQITKTQAEELCRLGVTIIICFDQDIDRGHLESVRRLFPDRMDIYAMVDRNGLLGAKMSPMDDMNIFNKMMRENVYAIPVKK